MEIKEFKKTGGKARMEGSNGLNIPSDDTTIMQLMREEIEIRQTGMKNKFNVSDS